MMVLEGCGFSVRNIAVMHVNNKYVRNGEVDAAAICATTDVTEEVKLLLEETKVSAQKAYQIAILTECPDLSPLHAGLGAFKDWLDICKSLVEPKVGSIYELGGINSAALELFVDKNITLIDDIPSSLSVSKSIDSQLAARRNGGPIVDEKRIVEFIESLEFPLYFFDYETMGGLVPYFDGMKPYGQYPFQYSLHTLDYPEAELRHEEYLHVEHSDPSQPIVNAMKSHFGSKGSILTWNMAFEKGCNKTLADFVPESAEFLNGLNERIVDLMTPFSSGAYVDYKFRGSASIKNVLPVIAPKLSYKDLGVQEGAAASRIWMETILDGKNQDNREKILSDLIQYCKLDTLAMVEIYKKLVEVVKV